MSVSSWSGRYEMQQLRTSATRNASRRSLDPAQGSSFDLVKGGGINGIHSDDLYSLLYPEGGSSRHTLKAHIWQINEMIADEGYRSRAVVRSIASSASPGGYHNSTSSTARRKCDPCKTPRRVAVGIFTGRGAGEGYRCSRGFEPQVVHSSDCDAATGMVWDR